MQRLSVFLAAVVAPVSSASCSGSGDPAPGVCYQGKAGALGVTEEVSLKVDTFSTGKGTLEFTGTGIQSITCKSHAFTKSGQEITTDLSDCVPSGVTVTDLKYCSDSDTVAVTVKDSVIPLPIHATMNKVSCDTMATGATLMTCTGSADPASAGVCYEGKGGALGVTEDVTVKLDTFASEKGTMDLTGTGVEAINCKAMAFSKNGQEISSDLSSCLPKGVTVQDIKYCSDQDVIAVSVKDSAIPFPVKTTLKKKACGPAEVVV